MNTVSLPPALSEEYSDIIVRQSLCQHEQTNQSFLKSSSHSPLHFSSSALPLRANFPVDLPSGLPAARSSDLPAKLPADLPAQPVSEQYTILYAPLSDHLATVEEIGYASVPKLFTEINVVSLEESGILPVRIQSFSEWSGKGVLMGFLDTGIDYTHPAFRNADGTTRILRFWDQADTSGLPPAGISYGTEYTEEDINRALFGGFSLAGPDSAGEAVSADHSAPAAALQNHSDAAANDKGLLQTAIPDPRGHGTAVAGIACGSADASEGFTGVAPESSIAFVKLKQAKQYLRDYFRIPENSIACQEDDLMLGIRYLSDCASALDMPLVICMSLGCSQGGHTGHTPLEDLINEMLYVPLHADEHLSPVITNKDDEKDGTTIMRPCICTITGTGNEAGLAHHHLGRAQPGNDTGAFGAGASSIGSSSTEASGTGTSDTGTSDSKAADANYSEPVTSANVELLIEQGTNGFTLEFWPNTPGLYTLGFTSPIGETISPIRPESGISREFSFLLEKSRIGLTWSLAERSTEPGGAQVALIRFTDPTPGIWTIHVGSLKSDASILSTPDFGAPAQEAPNSKKPGFGVPVSEVFHLWLPISGMVDPHIRFLSPDSDTTLVIPSCASSAITAGTWNAYEGSLYPHSGRGYTRNGHIKPDLASPGVRVTAPGASGSYTSFTGSCAASALTAGAAALLLSAGLRQDPPRYFSSEEVKQFLLLGARQRSNENYPNQAWGYGTMDLRNSLNRILEQNL